MRYLISSAALLLLLHGCKASGDGTSKLASGNVHEEGSPTRGLGTIRSALSIYYGDMEGQYPQDLAALTIGGKYLTTIPKVGPLDIHPIGSNIRNGTQLTDEGGWLYNNVATSVNMGNVMINCTHIDAKGSAWTVY